MVERGNQPSAPQASSITRGYDLHKRDLASLNQPRQGRKARQVTGRSCAAPGSALSSRGVYPGLAARRARRAPEKLSREGGPNGWRH
jgi:hypothetical protein